MRDVAVENVAVEAPKRFGTFLGVFTPSFLTILGVIMYQRLGWVVGQAGLTGAILIILLGHVISIPTGLSVASIATNHTVRTGGNYYIISRSLGLSVGGTIGLALYLALALGVSLYLIGFAEAFIAATGFTPFASQADNIRLFGSSACLLLAVLTLWSTSIALKSQLFVMAAIAISLASIAFGPSVQLDPATQLPSAGPPPSAATIFAVFFPAVTGFTAGVGMSGDLKDPRRSIPIGTMLAIAAGLVTYLALAVVLAWRAPPEVLRTNYNVLREMSVDARLVTAGVFAATLSSALGSLLGAPRTLQALAFDGIVPEALGRGRDEPRVAMLVTLLIAEAGILLAELDVVGAIITMFFLTCYGFLCLTCGLERWASPDFRPQFKVPVWVSLFGALACFLVMFQIDALSMFVAIGLMSGTYAVIKRRQLVLGSGDTWGGVWSAVVRMGLMRLQQSTSRSAQRNWRPNMLVVGRSRTRNPLVDFGRSLVADRGLLTHVHLMEGEPPKARTDRLLEEAYPGVFARIQGCEDIYDAIPRLAANFGLSGMETNTVLLGWPREAAQRRRYAQMIDSLMQLDLSVLMLRYDAQRGFGKYERIDVWWDGEASTGPLMLTLAHLLTTSPLWKRARVRVLVNGRVSQDDERARRSLDAIILEARVRAEGVILPPVTGSSATADRIRTESSRADLVLIHAMEADGDQGFVPTNDKLIRPLGTTLLVRPSTFFAQKAKVFDPATIDIGAVDEKLSVPTPVPELLVPLRTLEDQLSECVERFARSFDQPAASEEAELLQSVFQAAHDIRQLERRLERRGGRRSAARGLMEWARSRFNQSVEAKLDSAFGSRSSDASARSPSAWDRRLKEALQRMTEDIQDASAKLPEVIEIPTEPADWNAEPKDGVRRRLKKFRIRLGMRWLGRPPPMRAIDVRRPAEEELLRFIQQETDGIVYSAGLRRQQAILRARRTVHQVQRFFDRLMAELDQSQEEELQVEALLAQVGAQADSLDDFVRSVGIPAAEKESVRRFLQEQLQKAAAEVSSRLTSPRQRKRTSPPKTRAPEPARWAERHRSFVDALRLDLRVEACMADARRTLASVANRLRRELQGGPIGAIDRARQVMLRVVELRERYEGALNDSAELERSSGEDMDELGFRRDFIAAADELRAAFDQAYRPEVQEMVELLLTNLARGAERLPMYVVLPADLSEPGADINAGLLTVPSRRLAQSFLDSRLAAPVRRGLEELPEAVKVAQDTLVDAVRLVAFELEQAAAAGRQDRPEDVEEAGTLALGGTLEDRIQRLQNAQEDLETFLQRQQTNLLDDGTSTLSDIRSVVYGLQSAGSVGPPSRPMVEAIRRVRERAFDFGEGIARRAEQIRGARTRPTTPSTVVDAVLQLRDALAPDPEVQARLPLLYRRMFGRAALETPDLMVGRTTELEELSALCARWESGLAGPIGVVGEPRSGKTTLVNVWCRRQERSIFRVMPPPGGSASVEDLNAAVARAVGAREGQSAESALRSLAPGAIVLVDELGAWLERSADGMSAIRTLFRVFRRLSDRHFFVVVGSRFAFHLIEQLLDASSIFLSYVRCGPLSRIDLEAMLLLRQRTSDFELELEGGSRWWSSRLGNPMDRLYARTMGNVGEAVDVWRRSVTSVTERRIRIQIAPDVDASVLERLPLRWSVALQAVSLYRSVTVARMARTFRCSREEAQGLLLDLQRASLVRSERTGTWDLDPVLQAHVLRALRKRHLLP
ncbi:MAG: amino acid permease [Myxococcota bacterium]